jgi:hypothetical protein
LFILQPQRVVLDEQFERLRSESRRLEELLSRKQGEVADAHIDRLMADQLRLLTKFKAGIDAAVQVHDYSNYLANR